MYLKTKQSCASYEYNSYEKQTLKNPQDFKVFKTSISGLSNWQPAGQIQPAQATPIPAPERQKHPNTSRYGPICHNTAYDAIP